MRTDYYGRELPVDPWTGDVMPTIFLDDIRFRRYDLIRRSPKPALYQCIEHLDHLVNKQIYSEKKEDGGRDVVAEGNVLKSILAGIAKEVDHLKNVKDRLESGEEFDGIGIK